MRGMGGSGARIGAALAVTAPAVHMTRGDIARLFTDAHGLTRPLQDDPEGLTAFARRQLREVFLQADVGICGVNFAVGIRHSCASVTQSPASGGSGIREVAEVQIPGLGDESFAYRSLIALGTKVLNS